MILHLGIFAQQKAVFILLDGVPADVLEKVNTPVLDGISDLGGYTRSYQGGEKGQKSETPTISAPGYMNLITGTWGYKHNVWDNEVDSPNYDYWNIFRIVETANPSLNTAIFSTWEDNRTKLIGEGLPEAGNIRFDYSFDGFEKDTVDFPHDVDRQFIFQIDEHVSKEAARYLRQEGPDLSWVYLEFTDDMGHKYGDSPQFYQAVENADAQVGRIWSAVQYRMVKYQENWMILITTDHGRSPKDGKGHGGQLERERTTWIVTNRSNLKSSFYENPPVVDVLPSILDHLEEKAPVEVKGQFDGKSFIK
jgi:predicted AlkP superfamily pyrophosphatase or phosphodiesterase